jgi:hypothetical protein
MIDTMDPIGKNTDQVSVRAGDTAMVSWRWTIN